MRYPFSLRSLLWWARVEVAVQASFWLRERGELARLARAFEGLLVPTRACLLRRSVAASVARRGAVGLRQKLLKDGACIRTQRGGEAFSARICFACQFLPVEDVCP